MTDTATLVDHASGGDSDALQALLIRYMPTLRAFLRLNAGPLVTGRESISDLVQSVCGQVLEALKSFEYRGEAPFRKWLCEIALTKIRSKERRLLADKRHPAHEQRVSDTELAQIEAPYAAFASPSQVAIGKEKLESIAAAFEQLSPDDQQVVTMSRIWGLSHAEIAEQLGCSAETIRVRLHRALIRLASISNRKPAG